MATKVIEATELNSEAICDLQGRFEAILGYSLHIQGSPKRFFRFAKHYSGNARPKILATWEKPFWRALYMYSITNCATLTEVYRDLSVQFVLQRRFLWSDAIQF